MAHRDYERDDAPIMSTDPGHFPLSDKFRTKIPRSADAYCDSCHEPMTITPDDFEGMPKQGDDIVVVCWSCGVEQLGSYDIVPEWMVRAKGVEGP